MVQLGRSSGGTHACGHSQGSVLGACWLGSEFLTCPALLPVEFVSKIWGFCVLCPNTAGDDNASAVEAVLCNSKNLDDYDDLTRQ